MTSKPYLLLFVIISVVFKSSGLAQENEAKVLLTKNDTLYVYNTAQKTLNRVENLNYNYTAEVYAGNGLIACKFHDKKEFPPLNLGFRDPMKLTLGTLEYIKNSYTYQEKIRFGLRDTGEELMLNVSVSPDGHFACFTRWFHDRNMEFIYLFDYHNNNEYALSCSGDMVKWGKDSKKLYIHNDRSILRYNIEQSSYDTVLAFHSDSLIDFIPKGIHLLLFLKKIPCGAFLITRQIEL